ncbi:MAG: spore germination protein [Clostridia bacterium]|nr:spore germination protein [Clostridia bacterium]
MSRNYGENVAHFRERLRVAENFDVVERHLSVGEDELTLFYIDGFIKDGVMLRLMQNFCSMKGLYRGEKDACRRFADSNVPYVEVERTSDAAHLTMMVMSGAAMVLGSTFGDEAIVIDARTYPARTTQEPENDRVMQGARDGFVETLIFNTALIRRRIRDPHLTMEYTTVGGESQTDVVLCYMQGRADEKLLSRLRKKLKEIAPTHITLGTESLTEALIRRRWYNPFPKVRTTERPDTAAAELLEGRVLLLCDTSPQVMILPTSIFDFMQETDDYYFPPLTGCYLRLVRHGVFFLSLIITPLWYLFILYPDYVPASLLFLLPKETTAVPILLQLYLAEMAIDGLKLASMNTPNMLAGSLSIIGGLILSDFAVEVGWLSPEVILYMAFAAIASFTQQNHELGYAFKFLRVIILTLTAIFGIWGFAVGLALVPILLATNKTLDGGHGYLYPLIPWNGKAMARLFFRLKKEK